VSHFATFSTARAEGEVGGEDKTRLVMGKQCKVLSSFPRILGAGSLASNPSVRVGCRVWSLTLGPLESISLPVINFGGETVLFLTPAGLFHHHRAAGERDPRSTQGEDGGPSSICE
jgi:hypothetical protein